MRYASASFNLWSFLKAGLLLLLTGLMTACPDPDTNCDVPGDLRVIGVGPTSLTVEWNSVPTAINYQLTATSTTGQVVGPFVTSDTSFTFTGLSENTEYTIEVVTLCENGGESEPAIVSMRTGNIIIEIVVQHPIPDTICGNGNADMFNFSTPIPWAPQFNVEILKINIANVSGALVTKTYIVKDATGAMPHYYAPRSGAFCDNDAVNNPITRIGSVNNGVARLDGSGYSIQISPDGEVLSPTTGVDVLYSMMR